jgi:hypothetical protein
MPAQYLATGHTTGEECSSTGEGRHLTLEESYLIHPTHADGFVDGGDPVLVGENIVGVAFTSASAATDLIAIDTEGIWFLTATAVDEGGNSAIAPGDELYINKTTAVISKIRNQATHARFGYALGDVGSSLTAVVAIKVHWDPDVLTNDLIYAKAVTFTETGAGTYTGSITVPAGAFLTDVIVHAVALWDAATSAAMNVGDAADPDGFFAAVNLKATDLLAGESISFSHTGGKQGADVDVPAAGAHVRRRYLATERVVSGVVVSVGAGTAGRTRMTVYYSLPTTIVAATKV